MTPKDQLHLLLKVLPLMEAIPLQRNESTKRNQVRDKCLFTLATFPLYTDLLTFLVDESEDEEGLASLKRSKYSGKRTATDPNRPKLADSGAPSCTTYLAACSEVTSFISDLQHMWSSPKPTCRGFERRIQDSTTLKL